MINKAAQQLKSKTIYFANHTKISLSTLQFINDLTLALVLKAGLSVEDVMFNSFQGAVLATFPLNESTLTRVIFLNQENTPQMELLKSIKNLNSWFQNKGALEQDKYQNLITEFKSFYRNEKVALKFLGKVTELPFYDQKTMLDAFVLGKASFSTSQWKAKQKFVIRLYQLFEAKSKGQTNISVSRLNKFFKNEAKDLPSSFQKILEGDLSRYNQQKNIQIAWLDDQIKQKDEYIAELDEEMARLIEQGKKIDKILSMLGSTDKH